MYESIGYKICNKSKKMKLKAKYFKVIEYNCCYIKIITKYRENVKLIRFTTYFYRRALLIYKLIKCPQ